MRLFITLCVFSIGFFLEGCTGCSNANERQSEASEPERTRGESKWSGTAEVRMIKESGVYKIPVDINGSKMNFIFDTGASIISISETEARFLYKQGTLTEADFVGEANFTDANGDISSGMVVKLRTVKIGDRILHNVQASIVPNSNAPLLLGQTALAQFGKISIDYQLGTITFE